MAQGSKLTPLDALSQKAFAAGRAALPALRTTPHLNSFADVPSLRFAAGVGINCRPKPGQSTDGIPQPQECSWSDFTEGIKRYSTTVVGPTQADKRFNSAYVLAGSLRQSGQSGTDGVKVGHVMGQSGAPHLNAPPTRDDSALSTLTMLVIDCDQPTSSLALNRALSDLSLAYCVAPTWSATVECPKWRLFLQIAPLPAVGTVRGRAEARLRYAWLCGLLAAMGKMPVECGVCHVETTSTNLTWSDLKKKKLTPEQIAASAQWAEKEAAKHGPPPTCKSCRGSSLFSFDLSCWNYSRLHFLGGLRTADQSLVGREVRVGKGFALDSEAWLLGSGWPEFWAAAVAELGLDKPTGVGGAGAKGFASVGLSTIALDSDQDTEQLHPDPHVAHAMATTKAGLLERVRRALAYISSSSFPAAIVGQGGDTAVMRACSAVVSGFLVPVEYAGVPWARRVMDVGYAPRCSKPWSEAWIDRKLGQVRSVAGRELGALLVSGNGSAARERFYLSRVCTRCAGSSETKRKVGPLVKACKCGLCEGRGVGQERAYGLRGELLPFVGDELELIVEAACSCGLAGFDPRQAPANWVARPLIGARV